MKTTELIITVTSIHKIQVFVSNYSIAKFKVIRLNRIQGIGFLALSFSKTLLSPGPCFPLAPSLLAPWPHLVKLGVVGIGGDLLRDGDADVPLLGLPLEDVDARLA